MNIRITDVVLNSAAQGLEEVIVTVEASQEYRGICFRDTEKICQFTGWNFCSGIQKNWGQ